ncbi:hypothetical protein IFM89_025005, partial [Coptis chinensis]
DDYLSQMSGSDSDIEVDNETEVSISRGIDVSHKRSCFEPLDFGCPTSICSHCGAIVWYEERNDRSKKPINPKFSICCQNGKVQLPLLKDTPDFLKNLLDCNGGSKSLNYMENISIYNSMFAFTSTGGQVQSSVNDGKAPFVCKIKGQNYHKIGTLLPAEGVRSSKTYRMARDRFKECHVADVSIQLINRKQKDGRLYNLPSSKEIAGLIVGNGDEFNEHKDVIVDKKGFGLKRINELLPSFMVIHYPLLFPHAEDGYRLDIPYRNNAVVGKRKNISMREYYDFRLQQT